MERWFAGLGAAIENECLGKTYHNYSINGLRTATHDPNVEQMRKFASSVGAMWDEAMRRWDAHAIVAAANQRKREITRSYNAIATEISAFIIAESIVSSREEVPVRAGCGQQ